MVPPYSHRVSRVRRYSGYSQSDRLFVYRTLTFYGLLSHTIPLNLSVHVTVLTPGIFLLPVWPAPLSLATTYGISVDFSSSPYLDVSVQAVPLICLCIQHMMTRLSSCRIAPFGHPRIYRSLTAPRGFSQLVTSFFGSRCQGIPLVLFVA